ncbi:TonB-dependent receptor [Flavihumibacter rivuli]|uniref:TonB-dependent receptor plug domain-containing protein n=1 Tax=Flavihumibacter rivuli TaxID=2838156 RepID=UPI001BDE1645|nr:TonB-dependent receptor [Flavihumibacter rivuli]ULQ55919.1 TonB-dependent receptor [Flavihumibacter rivuli]
MSRSFGVVIAMIAPLATAFAQEKKDSAAQPLKEVVVTAHRKSVENLSIPYMVESIGAKTIAAHQPRTTPEALQGLNGVFVQKTNHGGGSPFVRGLTGNQLLILVDGIRLNNSTFRYGPNQYLNTIDAYSIQRIEVAKGTGSVQYGSDAIGGVVQVFSKEPEFSDKGSRWQGNLLGKYMSAGMEQTGRGELSYSSEKLAVGIGLTYRHFGDLVGGDTTGKQSPSGYEEYAFDIKLKWALPDRSTLTFANQFLRQNHVPVYHKVQLERFRNNEMDPQQRLLTYLRWDKKGETKWMRQLSVTASYQDSREGRISSKQGSTVVRKEQDAVSSFGLSADLSSEIARGWSANSGIELYHDIIGSERYDRNEADGTIRPLRALYPDGSTYGNYSIYTLHHFAWKNFSAELGLRYNAFNIRLEDSSLGQVRIQPSALVANAALMYHVNDHHKLFAALGNGYRAPNIDDMGSLGIVDFRYEVPARDLRAEQSINSELGYKFLDGRFSGAASVFHMDLRNLVTRVRVPGDSISGYPVYRKENVEEGYIWGWEAALSYRAGAHWQFSGNMAWQYGQNETRGEPMRRIPPVNGRLLAAYTDDRWSATMEWLFAGKQDRLAKGDREDNRIPQGGTPGWEVLNLYGGYRWRTIQMNAGLLNLFNIDYRTHGSGINGVGRSYWISVQWRW